MTQGSTSVGDSPIAPGPAPSPTGPGRSTWGAHQESAAAALHQLLVTDLPVPTGRAREQLLGCREAALDAVDDQLAELGATPDNRRLRGSGRGHVSTEHMLANPTRVLGAIAASLPRLEQEQRQSPLEALAQPSADPMIELWRHAGVELTASAHALTSSDDRPWRTEPAAAWWVLRDVAASVEALTVLDARLRASGALDGLREDQPGPVLAEQRLVAATAARMATWYASDHSPDLAGAPPAPGPHSRGPVRLIRGLTDLAAGQRQLARYLRPRQGPRLDGDPVVTAAAARVVVRGQLDICARLTAACERTPHLRRHAADFGTRGALLRSIEGHLPRLVDVRATKPHMPTVWQQQELTLGLRRHVAGLGELSGEQVHDLAAATHDVVHEFATAARRELKYNMSILTQKGRLSAAVLTGSEPYAALNAAANAPTIPVRAPVSGRREALRRALDLTDGGVRAPTPFAGASHRTPPSRPPLER